MIPLLRRTYLLLLSLTFLHYAVSYTFKIPLGFVFLGFVICVAIFPLAGNSLLVPLRSRPVVNLSASYVLVLLLSAMLGLVLAGLQYERPLVDLFLQAAPAKMRSEFIATLPTSIPAYQEAMQPLLGLQYLALFPIALVANAIAISKLRLSIGHLIEALIPLLVFNTIIVLAERLFPVLHTGMMILGRYGGGEYFFTFRALGISLNVYINSFLNLVLFVFAFVRFLSSPKRSDLFLVAYSLVVVVLSGTRIGIIAAGVAAVLVVLRDPSLVLRVAKKYTVLVVFLVAGGLAYVLTSEEFAKLVKSVVELSDEKGSTQLHLFLFLNAIDMVLAFPFGIGIGKADFGAFSSTDWVNTESHMMSLAIGAGFPGVVLFSLINWKLLNLVGSSRPRDIVVFALCGSVFLVSWINMQYYQSLLPVVLLAVVFSTALAQETPDDVWTHNRTL